MPYKDYGYEIDRLLPPLGTASNDIDGDLTAHWQNDDTVYDVERVIRAERVGQRYKIWFKWVGSDDHTWRWWSEIRKELTDDNPLLQEISAAADAERDRYNAAYGNHDEFDEHLHDPLQSQRLRRSARQHRHTRDRGGSYDRRWPHHCPASQAP